MRTALCVAMALAPTTLTAQTLTLDSCLALARRNNADIRTTQLDVLKAQEVKKQVFTKFFPQVQLGALGYHAAEPLIRFGINDIQSDDMRELLQAIYEGAVTGGSDIKSEMTLMKRGASISATAAQPIFAGGRIVNGNRLAQLGVEAAELQAAAKERDVLENIESAYYLVTGLQQKVATLTAALDLIDSLDRTVQSALANGLVTKSDALQVQLKRNEMLANQQQLASGIRLAKRLLCTQIGIEYSDTLLFADPQLHATDNPLLADGSQQQALRPEVQLLQLNVEAEQLQRRLTLGETLPQLTFVGSAYYGNMVKNDPAANAVALLSLSIPLTSWWETSHKLRQHDVRIAEARLKQEHLGRMMSIEEDKALSDMLDAAVYRGVDVIGRQPSFDLRVYGTHELFQNRHFCIQDIRDFLIAIRIQVFQGKIFQLPLCPLHAEAVSQRSIDLHGLQRFRSLFLLGLILHCAHVVETIRDLD